MYEIIHTRAIVLLERVEREYDKTFFLFTEELGLVSVSATSILKPGAKLTSMLQPYSIISCDIVVGKSTKKITTIIEKTSFEHLLRNPAKKQAFLAVFHFIVRMIPRNTVVRDIFGIFCQFIHDLEMIDIDPQTIAVREVETLYTILALLGYIDTALYDVYDRDTLPDYTTLYKTVNTVLREIHT
jgi:recombinational DNA repair protein (RecF pathway)